MMRPPFPILFSGTQRSLAQVLFGNGEDGFLFGDFAELDEMFTTSTGPTNVAANDDPVGLALDDHAWGSQTLAQMVAAATELRGGGAPALLGAATAASYNTGTGVGSATRVDASNQSYVTVTVSNNALYRIDIEITGAVGVNIRSTVGGSIYFIALAGRQVIYAQTISTDLSFAANANAATAQFTIHSIKRIPGNHILQATTASRPLWKANAGKPYLAFDGVSMDMRDLYIPGAAGTLAVAFNKPTGGGYVVAGGTGTGNKRARLYLNASGFATFDFNTSAFAADAVDHRNANTLMAMTWGGGVFRGYVNGSLVSEQAVAANMDGAGLGYALGAVEGGGGSFALMSLSAAVARSAFSTPADIARINAEYQRTF